MDEVPCLHFLASEASGLTCYNLRMRKRCVICCDIMRYCVGCVAFPVYYLCVGFEEYLDGSCVPRMISNRSVTCYFSKNCYGNASSKIYYAHRSEVFERREETSSGELGRHIENVR